MDTITNAALDIYNAGYPTESVSILEAYKINDTAAIFNTVNLLATLEVPALNLPLTVLTYYTQNSSDPEPASQPVTEATTPPAPKPANDDDLQLV